MEFPEEYFEGAYKDGFFVCEKMKRCWAAQMEVLKVVQDICEKHGLQYFMSYGSLLGTVRHKGFIPWDDDIDISLKRKDYNKLIKYLQEELPEGFELAGMYALKKEYQEGLQEPLSRVVNRNTICVDKEHLTRFHGCPYVIGIDINPLDYIPRDKEFREVQKSIWQVIITTILEWDMLQKENKIEESLIQIEDVTKVSLVRDETIIRELWRLSDRMASLCSEEEADYVSNFPGWVQNQKYLMNKEWFNKSIDAQFEIMKVKIPKEYDKVLSSMYGYTYMRPLRYMLYHDYPFYREQEMLLVNLLKDNQIKKLDTLQFCKEVMK